MNINTEIFISNFVKSKPIKKSLISFITFIVNVYKKLTIKDKKNDELFKKQILTILQEISTTLKSIDHKLESDENTIQYTP